MSVFEALGKNILNKGQSLMEWATLLAVVGLAILGMQVYVQRGLQGKTRDLTNAIIGPQQRASSGGSEETITPTITTSSSTTRVSTLRGGAVNKRTDERTVTKSNTKTVF